LSGRENFYCRRLLITSAGRQLAPGCTAETAAELVGAAQRGSNGYRIFNPERSQQLSVAHGRREPAKVVGESGFLGVAAKSRRSESHAHSGCCQSAGLRAGCIAFPDPDPHHVFLLRLAVLQHCLRLRAQSPDRLIAYRPGNGQLGKL
jgi:hypothetical protein